MKYYVVQKDNLFDVTTSPDKDASIVDTFEDVDEAFACCEFCSIQMEDELEYQRQVAHDAYIEENRDIIRQQELYQQHLNEY